MKLRNSVSPAAIELIKRFEGFRRAAARLDDGRWTVGYGHTRSAREGATVSEADAEALLGYDLVEVQAAVNDWTFTPLSQNQFDALVSFVFNIGLEGFRHSTVLRRVNEGALLQAACAMEMWRKADFEGERIVVDALVRRRAAEKALFLTPEEGFVAAPSAVVQPRLDYDVGAAVPRVPPAELKDNPEPARAAPIAEPSAFPAAGESPTERALAAVSARLQQIWPDDEAVEATAEEPSEEPAPFPHETAASAPDEAPTAAAADAPAAEPARIEPTAAARGAEPHASSVQAVRSIFEDTREDKDRPGLMPLAILGAIGIFLFGGGVFWALRARPTGNLIGPSGIGFLLGMLGVVCVASAVYFVLDRYFNAED
ncbi:MAG TPA: glycoside hydrolase family protein [Caulobacteraceae bacterium]|nr:glycoside hydrolase family protein [Caulobacteraceae bacterium]